MKKNILFLLFVLFAAMPVSAQFYVEWNDRERTEVDGNLTFSKLNGNYSIGGDGYQDYFNISKVTAITRMPSIFRIYTRQYDLRNDGVYVHPYNHYRVDYDDPNCCNEYGNVADPGDPFWPNARIVESKPNDTVLIIADFDLGYDSPANHGNDPTGFLSVKGLDSNLQPTGNEYPLVWNYDSKSGLWAWFLKMPKETVLIEATAHPLTTYVGQEFVGEYDCFFIPWGSAYGNTVRSVSTPDASLELKDNTVFTLKSETGRVPGYDYDNRGVYIYKDGDITFDEEACKNIAGRDNDGIALQGKYDPQAWVMMSFDLEDGGLDETYRYFFTVKKSAKVTDYKIAANEAGERFLIAATVDGEREYWYYNAPGGQKTLSKVKADFAGKDIDEEGVEATVYSEDGVALFKYKYADGKPVFEYPGREAGTYTDEAGEGEDLVLDGFGEGTYGDREGTYTIDESGMNLVFTCTDNGEEITFVLYKNDGTYSKQEAQPSAGPTGTYSTDGSYSYEMRVTVNGDGKADFYFANGGTVYYDEHGVSCVYDATAKTIVLSGFMMGNPETWGNSSLQTVDFTVSDDGSTLTCQTEKIKQISKGPSTSIVIKGTVLEKN